MSRQARETLMALALLLACAPAAVRAATDPAALCEEAAVLAARQTGVPLSVLQTIALAESGQAQGGVRRPWPWAVNFGGNGTWFASRHEAELAVEERRALGATNIDIGCFQINHRWHGEAFNSTSEMFDPAANALYAAGFLSRLHAETGDWTEAAARYHSRTPEHAEAYRARFVDLSDGLVSGGPAPDLSPRENRFPLLQAGQTGALGSLVPSTPPGPGLFGVLP
jgi:hypothetical protein